MAARVVGAGATALSKSQKQTAVQLMVQALHLAVEDTRGLLTLQDIDTLIALPSLMSEQHFMIAHAVAQEAQLTPRRGMLVRTLDVGGAGPVAALLAAKRAIEHEGRRAVAIVAGDTVASAPLQAFLARADGSCKPAAGDGGSGGGSGGSAQAVPSPVIPNLYDRVACWHMQQYGTTREQLAMCASLMTFQASHHPGAMHKRPRLLQEVLSSPPVAPVTTKLECAKLADGAAALVLVPADGAAAHSSRAVSVLGGGEASGPLAPPQQPSEACFSAGEAAAAAYAAAGGLSAADIDYFGLYDCFPICFIRAVEAVGLAPKGGGGAYVQRQYQALLGPLERQHATAAARSLGSSCGGDGGSSSSGGSLRSVWPVNTNGGLLGFGAPWEVPAMLSLVEAVAQLRGEASGRQVPGARHALVYGNGGIFSASAVAILQRNGDDALRSRL